MWERASVGRSRGGDYSGEVDIRGAYGEGEAGRTNPREQDKGDLPKGVPPGGTLWGNEYKRNIVKRD